jgi:hypothetical protein
MSKLKPIRNALPKGKAPMPKMPAPKLSPAAASQIRAKANRILGGACVLLLALFASQAHAAVRTAQVTIGAANTLVLSSGAHLNCRWIVFQNNATHAIHIGDTNITTTRGLQLAPGNPGGSFYVGPDAGATARDLGTWYINGTQNDVIDVIYDDGQ